VTSVLALLALAAFPLAAPRTAPASLRTRVEGAVARALATKALEHAILAVEVRALPSGKVLYARGAEVSMSPASVLKLATTAAALDTFGPDARFRTTLQSSGRQVSPGVLQGDLYLVGGGDPSLSRELATRPEYGVFAHLAEALHNAGVRQIEGRVIGADVLFAGERRGRDWTWEDLVWWYGAEVAALTFADGSANLKIAPGSAPGEPAHIERHPPSSFYQVDSTASTCARGMETALTLDRPSGRNTIAVGGCVAAASPVLERWVALEDPVRYAATVFAEALAARGIQVGRGVATATTLPAPMQVLAAYDGAPLAEVLKDVNKPSHNLRAEMLLRLLGHTRKGEGSAAAGLSALLEFLKARGVETAGWDVSDGSGLSRSDLVTARGMAQLLLAMHTHPHAAVFRASLPVAGIDGTLRRRFASGKTASRIQAKTGTLRHTAALAGYATPLRGEPVAFAIFVNHATAPIGEVQDAIDAVAAALVGR
jgi:PBP4 family serine-type D-alanyl-D-alanine carboxypeptidase